MTGLSTVLRRHILQAGAALPLVAVARHATAQVADVPVGLVLPFTGATGSYGPDMKKAAELAAAMVNDAGGVLGGRRLRLFIEDEETSATASVVATRKLLEANKVVMVAGFWGSPPALAARPLIVGANKVQMVSCSAPAVTDGDTKGLVFRFQAAANQWGSPCAKMAQQAGAKTVAILAQQNPFTLSIVDSFKAALPAVGGTVTKTIIYNPDQPSYRAEVEQAFGPEPDAVLCLSLLTDMVAIVKEAYRGGFRSKILGLGTGADADGAFIKAAGPEVSAGILHIQPAPPLDSSSYGQFVKRMGAPEGTVFLFAGNIHDQVCTAALAMEHAKTDDPAVWSKSMRAVCNPPGEPVDDVAHALDLVRRGQKVNFAGAGATCDFDERGDQTGRSFVLQVIEGGRNKILGIVT